MNSAFDLPIVASLDLVLYIVDYWQLGLNNLGPFLFISPYIGDQFILSGFDDSLGVAPISNGISRG